MATIRYVGASDTGAQVDTATVGGTVEIGDKFRHTIGNKRLTVIAESTDLEDVAEQIATEWNALDPAYWPEFREIVAQANGPDITFQASTAGKPFTLTVDTVETNDGTADNQTYSSSTTVDNRSPGDMAVAANYSGGALPANGDTLIIDADSVSTLWNLDALSAVTLAKLRIAGRNSVYGLDDVNDAGYPEYRVKAITLSATLVEVDTDSPRINLNLQSAATTVTVYRTGSDPADVGPRRAMNLSGSNASNELHVLRGNVAVGLFAGESAQFPVLRLGYVSNVAADSNVSCGEYATLGAIIVNGGNLSTKTSVSSMRARAGSVRILAGAVSALIAENDAVAVYDSTGTLGGNTVVSGNAVLDFSQDPRDKTVTNPIEVFGNGRVLDPNNVVNTSGSLIVDLNQTANLANIVIGSNRRATIGAVS